MLKLSFHQSKSEAMVRAAATMIFAMLKRSGIRLMTVSEVTDPPQYGFTASATSEPIGPKFVRITDLQNGRIDWDRVPFCDCPDSRQYLLQPNDILFAR